MHFDINIEKYWLRLLLNSIRALTSYELDAKHYNGRNSRHHSSLSVIKHALKKMLKELPLQLEETKPKVFHSGLLTTINFLEFFNDLVNVCGHKLQRQLRAHKVTKRSNQNCPNSAISIALWYIFWFVLAKLICSTYT